MRIGLTGTTGVLGQSLILTWKDAEIIPFDSDVSVHSNVIGWFKRVETLDGVVHLAALVPVDKVKAEPLRAFQVNVTGTCNILETIRNLPIAKRPWLFYCSSSHIYQNSSEPIKESSPINPVSLYGLTKAQGDKWCEIYRNLYALEICVGRVFSYSSPKQPESYFIPSMIRKIKEAPPNGTIEARGLHGTRDFLTPEQIVQAIKFLFSQRLNDTFNIGTGYGVKLLDIVTELQKKLGRSDLRIHAPETDTNHLVADPSHLKDAGLNLEFDLQKFLEYILSR